MRSLVVLLLTVSQTVLANMASPYFLGTQSAAPFSSKRVEVQREVLLIKLKSNFQQADYDIQYHINCDTDGVQMPLLFYAQQYSSGFQVWVDDKPVELVNLPLGFDGDNYLFGNDTAHTQDDEDVLVKIYWDKDEFDYYLIGELKYFVVDLAKGNHMVRVTYTANSSVDRSGWVKEYGHQYSLSPAKHWKGFGGLLLQIDDTELPDKNYTVNLPVETVNTGKMGSFTGLPSDQLILWYRPQVNAIGWFLIKVGPVWLALMFSLILLIIHFAAMYRYRQKHPTGVSLLVWLVGMLVPALCMILYILSFLLIDTAIGEQASGRHGYTFMIFMFYPLAAPLYLLVCWLLDKYLVRNTGFFIKK